VDGEIAAHDSGVSSDSAPFSGIAPYKRQAATQEHGPPMNGGWDSRYYTSGGAVGTGIS